MAKRIVEDVVPPERRSIRNIPIPPSRSTVREASLQPTTRSTQKSRVNAEMRDMDVKPVSKKSMTDRAESFDTQDLTEKKPRRNVKKKIIIALGIILVLVVLSFGLSFMFKNATVTITPKDQTLPINISLTASAEPGESELSYQTITLSKTKELEVPANGEEGVERKASGSIIIYNNFSSQGQVLVKNTRFRTPTGLIFRIQDQITVPGKRGNTPGSIKVMVFADEPGEEYNVGLQDFVIPGFESDPARFKAITAKSDPNSPIQGGFVGMVKKVSEATLASANATMEGELEKDIQQTVEAQIPSGYMSIKKELEIMYQDLPQGTGSTPNTATLHKKATANITIISEQQLEDAIIKAEYTDTQSPIAVKVGNLRELPIAVQQATGATDSTLKLNIQGNAHVIWEIDNAGLSQALAGKKRSNIKSILSSFESIAKAQAVVRPPWSTTFPSDPEKIYIEVVEP